MTGFWASALRVGIWHQWTPHCLHQRARRRCRAFSPVLRAHASSAANGNHKQRIALSIEKLNEDGDGVGSYVSQHGGTMHVKVPFAAPGDTVEAEIWDRDVEFRENRVANKHEDPWPLFGQATQVLKASAHRVRPLCTKYFQHCGGCKLQHVRYAQQLEAKQDWIRNLFASRNHSPDMELRDIVGVETMHEPTTIYQYRNKMEFTCSAHRWLLHDDKCTSDSVRLLSPFTVGMFPMPSVSARRSREMYGKSNTRRRRGVVWSPKIVSLHECLLQSTACNRLLQQLVSKCEKEGVQAYDFTTHEGFLKQIVLRRGVNRRGGTEIMVGLVTTTFDGEQSNILKSIVQDLVQEQTSDIGDPSYVVSIIQHLDDQAQCHHEPASESIQALGTTRVLYGSAHLEDTILGHHFQISLDSFFQPNSAQASVLYREIQHLMMALPEKPIVWDLFCGVGSIGICMGAYAKAVVGFELVEAALERARSNARLNGYSTQQMQFFCVDLTKQCHVQDLQAKLSPSSDLVAYHLPDVVILDPPRAGLHKKLIQMLQRLAPRYICYVSCNPHSQVRDLDALCAPSKPPLGNNVGSYRVRHLQPVDMLPHTPHIETIAWLERCD
ncbi:hypothetical protein PsorP6_010760 [Peronosclerospora sorghi]|uniref:Uncharacterized protein n=1 Tax=Peronosclerospora sorghi TaxID=230839 RepID=A0ACC0VWR7_9STRA|nr:hypothetical protein PsorP6_010760 [Peronosclerospora sorghi]